MGFGATPHIYPLLSTNYRERGRAIFSLLGSLRSGVWGGSGGCRIDGCCLGGGGCCLGGGFIACCGGGDVVGCELGAKISVVWRRVLPASRQMADSTRISLCPKTYSIRSSLVLSTSSMRRSPPLTVNHTPHNGTAMTKNSRNSLKAALSMFIA